MFNIALVFTYFLASSKVYLHAAVPRLFSLLVVTPEQNVSQYKCDLLFNN